MKKHLLLTTALVAAFAMASTAHADHISSGDLVVNNGDTINNTSDSYYDTITVNGGTVNITNDSKIKTEKTGDVITISGGNVNLDNGNLKGHNGNMTITGGTIEATNDSEIDAGVTTISGNTVINLSEGAEIAADSILNINGGTINSNDGYIVSGPYDENEGIGLIQMTSGTINMQNAYLGADNNNGNAGNVQVMGGTINVQSGDNYLYTSNEAETNYISGQNTVVNISEGATLSAYSKYTEEDGFSDIATINLLDNATINLEGNLIANVEADGSTINFNSSDASIDGDVMGGSLVFSADNSISHAITGSLNDINSISIVGSSLVYDREIDEYTDSVNSFSMSDGASFTGPEISANNSIDINGGTVVAASIRLSDPFAVYSKEVSDLNIKDAYITVDNSIEEELLGYETDDYRNLTLTGNADMNIEGDTVIDMDCTNSLQDFDHDGGILHEGKEGDINIRGGEINLTGEVAKIERGGYDTDWIYDNQGNAVMSEYDFYGITEKFYDNASDEDFVIAANAAGLDPETIDKTPYHVSTGNINISGGEINLYDGARISLTELNSGDLNIANATITGKESFLENRGTGNINIAAADVDVAVIETYNGDITIDGGTVSANEIDGTTVTIQSGDVTVTDGEIEGFNVNINGGNINLQNAGVYAYEQITINGGNFTAENSFFQSGDDELAGSDEFDMLIANANISAVDTDIESNGKMTIENSIVDIENTTTQNLEPWIDYGDLTEDVSDELYGIYTRGDVELDGSEVTLTKSYINADGNLSIYGQNKLTLNTSRVDTAAITIEDGELNIINSAMHGMYDISVNGGTTNIDNGELTVDVGDADDNGEFAQGVFTMTSGKINLSNGGSIGIEVPSENDVSQGTAEMSGGEINVLNYGNLVAQQLSMTGGEINVNNSATFGIIKGVSFDDTNQSSTLEYSSVNMYNDAVINLGGTLYSTVNNAGKFNVLSTSARLNGNLNVNNNGVVDLGTNKLTVDGDVAFNEGSKLALVFTSKDKVGQIDAKNINISETNTTLDMSFNNASVADSGVEVQVLNASEEFAGKFATIVENSEYNIEDKGNGLYAISKKSSSPDEGGDDSGDDTPSVIPVSGDAADVWNDLDTSSVQNETTLAVAERLTYLRNHQTTEAGKQAYEDALTALAPETAPAATQTAAETAGAVFNAVGSRLSGGSLASNQGMSSGDALNGISVWVQGMFNHAEYDGNKHSKGFDADTWGTALGIEKQFNRSVKAGAGYAYSKTEIDGFMRDTDVKTHTAILYGEYKPSNWYANAIISYGWSDYEEDKNVAGVSVKSKYDLESFALQAMTGYDIYSTFAKITPEAGLRYVHVEQDDYTDTSDQHIKSEDSDIVTGVMGAKITKDYNLSNDMLLKPEFKAAMTYDISHDNSKSTVTLIDGSSYSVSGKPLNRFGVEVGGGVTAELNDNVELFFGYEGKFRKDYQDHSGLISAKYKF